MTFLGRQCGEVEQDSINEQERELRFKWDLHCITNEDTEPTKSQRRKGMDFVALDNGVLAQFVVSGPHSLLLYSLVPFLWKTTTTYPLLSASCPCFVPTYPRNKMSDEIHKANTFKIPIFYQMRSS